MTGRNDLCPCGSGKKYKKCCLAKDNVEPADELRQLEQLGSKINRNIEQFCAKYADQNEINFSWQSFLGWTEVVPEGDLSEILEYGPMFNNWRLYHWHSEESIDPSGNLPFEHNIPAAFYLSKRPVCVKDRDYIHAAMEAYYCYYQIIDVVESHSMLLKNLLTNQEVAVLERTAAWPENIGDVLFTTVVELDGIKFLLGTGSYAFGEFGLTAVQDFRQSVIDSIGKWSPHLIKEYEPELLDLYWSLRDELFNPQFEEDDFEVPTQQNPFAVFNDPFDNVTQLPEMPHITVLPEYNNDSTVINIAGQVEMRYLRQWLKDKQPILNNLTPRQAALDSRHHNTLISLADELKFQNPFHRKWLFDQLSIPMPR